MKLMTTLGACIALVAGSVGIACATVPQVSNGNFSATSPTQTTPRQFNGNSGSCGFGNWGDEFVSGWATNNGGYAVWYPSASAASGTQACTRYGNTGDQYLPASVTAPPIGPGMFVGLDGQPGLETWLSQTITGLTPGDHYEVDFYWASTQEMSRTGATTEQFQVSLGTEAYLTSVNSIGTHGWSGWAPGSFTFTPDSSSEVLKFLSIGTPGNLPPFALLSNVSMHGVPEPPVLASFGVGLLGLGLLTMAARRREQRRRDAEDDVV